MYECIQLKGPINTHLAILAKKPFVDCEDYITIRLMGHITKILLSIIEERIRNQIDKEVAIWII